VTEILKHQANVAPPVPDAERMAALDRERLPVLSLAKAIPHLRRPFTSEAIRFKVQSVFKDKEPPPSAASSWPTSTRGSRPSG
jgi:hypothetical protein